MISLSSRVWSHWAAKSSAKAARRGSRSIRRTWARRILADAQRRPGRRGGKAPRRACCSRGNRTAARPARTRPSGDVAARRLADPARPGTGNGRDQDRLERQSDRRFGVLAVLFGRRARSPAAASARRAWRAGERPGRRRLAGCRRCAAGATSSGSRRASARPRRRLSGATAADRAACTSGSAEGTVSAGRVHDPSPGLGRAERRVDHRLGGGQVHLHQDRRDREHVADVVESIADIVGREVIGRAEVEADQVADRVVVLGAIEPPDRHPRRRVGLVRSERADRARRRGSAAPRLGRGSSSGGMLSERRTSATRTKAVAIRARGPRRRRRRGSTPPSARDAVVTAQAIPFDQSGRRPANRRRAGRTAAAIVGCDREPAACRTIASAAVAAMRLGTSRSRRTRSQPAQSTQHAASSRADGSRFDVHREDHTDRPSPDARGAIRPARYGRGRLGMQGATFNTGRR